MFTILNVGRLDFQKGQDLLLDAFAYSGLAESGWRLRIVGSGADYSSLVAQSEWLGVAKSVDWFQATAAMENVYAQAYIFAFPPRYEGFPNALGNY